MPIFTPSALTGHGMLSGNNANDTLLSYKTFVTSYMLADKIEIV